MIDGVDKRPICCVPVQPQRGLDINCGAVCMSALLLSHRLPLGETIMIDGYDFITFKVKARLEGGLPAPVRFKIR